MTEIGHTSESGSEPLLSVSELCVRVPSTRGELDLVYNISFDLAAGETLAVVGESGSGKTMMTSALAGLAPGSVRVTGSVRFKGSEILGLSDSKLKRLRGSEIGFIFQEPLTAFNPVKTIGDHLVDARQAHVEESRRLSRIAAVDRLAGVQIPQPELRADSYSFQFSGGMRQRAMIALATINDPALLIADEPTTALDVTVQLQVIDLLKRTQAQSGAGIIFITHDLALVAQMADRVLVMYSGSVIESGPVHSIFRSPKHPYTKGLLASIPRLDSRTKLQPLPGKPPLKEDKTNGCSFLPRCFLSQDRKPCNQDVPVLLDVGGGQSSACHFALELG